MWGEFLDFEWYYDSPGSPPRPEPWRRHRLAARCFELPRELLEQLAQAPRLAQISRDVERLDHVRTSLADVGLREPLEIAVDGAGHIALRDGHHRLVATRTLPGFEHLPAFITPSDGIAVRATNVLAVLEPLLRSVQVSSQPSHRAASARRAAMISG
jgi:hypothetical protein